MKVEIKLENGLYQPYIIGVDGFTMKIKNIRCKTFEGAVKSARKHPLTKGVLISGTAQ